MTTNATVACRDATDGVAIILSTISARLSSVEASDMEARTIHSLHSGAIFEKRAP